MTGILPTLAPTISSTGITAVSLADILGSLTASYQAVVGSDVVVGASTQDQSDLATRSQAIYDTGQVAVQVYNSFRPQFAQGAGLSSIVKINGLNRDIATNTTAPVLITGTAGTIITNGLVTDGTYQYSMPASVTIPTGGSITVTVTCTALGAITAASGAINSIVNPQLGWQTAVSTAAATVGAPVETDAALRQRQSVSTGLPALTPLQAITAALENTVGVTAVMPYENDTNATDGNGLPPHSIAMVVQGGTVSAVTQTIANTKNPGTYTYGTTSATVIDPTGVPNTIRYFIPTQVLVDVTVNIKAYTGYVSTTGALIQSQIAAYINSIGIGGTDGYVFYSKLFSPADDTGILANTYNVTGITFGVHGGSLSTTDLVIAFNAIPVANVITINVS